MPRLQASDFQVVALLGAGDVGRVYLVKKNKNVLIASARGQEYFAMKVMSLYDMRRRSKLNRLHAECDILLSTQHPFIMQLHAVFADERNYYLIMEFCQGGDLAGLLRRQPGRRFPERVALQYASEVLSALEYLHFHGILYRDLKTENVLIHADGHLRLTDFDLSKQFANVLFAPQDDLDQSAPFSTRIAEQSQSLVGTPEYLSPELISGSHSQATDFWALGIFIYELLYGVTPFYVKGGGVSAIMRHIQNGVFGFPAAPKTSAAVKELIRKLLVAKPEKRLGARYGCAEIKRHPWFKHVNFAIIYEPALKVGGDGLLENFTQIPRENEQIAKELAGTGFQLPARAQQFVPQAIKLIQQAGLPVQPQPLDIGALRREEEQRQGRHAEARLASTYAGRQSQPQRAKLQELFAQKKQDPPLAAEE